ncbi:MAG: hypothetical protein AVDCRST_MAG19-4204 [uncultured Thermomicrobiales bacterium]|uniref:Disintegrin domain-containing protein n=1 Tax=uncultured Thermomicrobiales bacterium TaxID=1645740 RepID=A0A6J4VMT8_9BACT|nr:MAG: hypothetical protein AVDCRST_MAG19-4204 [uncultured Thermomicrobiales bacterium]
MDDRRFDDLARALSGGPAPRRAALRLLGGGALGGLLAVLGREDAAAACRAPSKVCARDSQCCSKRCSRKGRCLCTKAAHCPKPARACEVAVCAGGRCGTAPAPAGTVCRPAVDACGLTEVCDGTSRDCPADQHKPDSPFDPCPPGKYCCEGRCALPPDASCTADSECCTSQCIGGYCGGG